MRILITGSRSWTDRETIRSAIVDPLDRFDVPYENVVIVHGACPTGADYLASIICAQEGIPQERHPADWETHGKSAGFLRNSEMVSLGADLCLAFIHNGSAGASMTAKLASEAGIPTRIYESSS